MDDENRVPPSDEPAAEPPAAEAPSPPEVPPAPEPPAPPAAETTSDIGAAVESTARDFAEGAKSAWSELTGATTADESAPPSAPGPSAPPAAPPVAPPVAAPAPPAAPVPPPQGQYAPPPPGAHQAGYAAPTPTAQQCPKSKVAAGVLGILLGSLGIHKFYLGYTLPGIIMLAITVLTLGTLSFIPGLIGLIEGILYLTKTDDEFCATYVYGKKEWF